MLEKCEAGISFVDSWHLYRLTPSIAAVQVLLIYNLSKSSVAEM